MVFVPLRVKAQNYIECKDAPSCNGWVFHNNKMGLGTGWSADKIPRTTLHLHEFSSTNTFLNITNQSTGFPSISENRGMWIGMMGDKALISNFQNDNLVLASGNNEQLIIQPDGKVGVGTSTPQTLLDVNGLLTIRGGNPGINKILTSDAVGTASWQSLQAGNGISINGLTITNTAPDIPISITGSGLVSVSGSYPSFTISATPYAAGTGISIQGNTIHSVWTRVGNHIYNNNNNYVAIGLLQSNIPPLNAEPVNVLHIHGRSTQGGLTEGLQITHEQTGKTINDGLVMGYEVNASRPNFVVMNKENGSLKFGTNNTVYALITSTGNVGIGIANPTAKLHSAGTVRFENLPQVNSIGSDRVLLIDTQGNLKQAAGNLLGDNFGNHTATQNIKLNNQWLSNDGNNRGIKISNLGDVLIYGSLPSGQEKTVEQNHGFEITTRGRIPERRGISVDDDPGGNVSFWIHNWQNPSAFNFMRNDNGTSKKLMTITKQGNVGINVDNPAANLHTNGTVRFEQLPSVQQISNENVLLTDGQGNVKQSTAVQLKDNMGNHLATQNINLGTNWLSPDGNENKGLQLKDNGNVQIGSGIRQINIGKAYSNAPYYLSSYIGFNAQRNNHAQWTFATDGANNGGAAIVTDVAGNMRIVTYRPQSGNNTITTTDADILDNAPLLITSNQKIGLRTTQINTNADVQIKGSIYVEDKLGIGICLSDNNNPKNYSLAVNGIIGAKEVFVEINETPWPDYVFQSDYKLMPVKELEKYIQQHKHLPGMPTEMQIESSGLPLSQMNVLLLKKIEELTLYIIELNKKLEKYETR